VLETRHTLYHVGKALLARCHPNTHTSVSERNALRNPGHRDGWRQWCGQSGVRVCVNENDTEIVIAGYEESRVGLCVCSFCLKDYVATIHFVMMLTQQIQLGSCVQSRYFDGD